jgi:hypothetical protein
MTPCGYRLAGQGAYVETLPDLSDAGRELYRSMLGRSQLNRRDASMVKLLIQHDDAPFWPALLDALSALADGQEIEIVMRTEQ